MERCGKNRTGYAGETININAVLSDCVAAAQAKGWSVEAIHPAPRLLLGLTRRALRPPQYSSSEVAPRLPGSDVAAKAPKADARRIYISAGMHGDEPAGPLAAQRLLQTECLAGWFGYLALPLLKPDGLRAEPPRKQRGPRPQPAVPGARSRGNPRTYCLAQAPASVRFLPLPP